MLRHAIATITIVIAAAMLLGATAHAADGPATFDREALQGQLAGPTPGLRERAAAIGREIADRALIALRALDTRAATRAVPVAAARQTQKERS
jgi:hypothetical protein